MKVAVLARLNPHGLYAAELEEYLRKHGVSPMRA